MGIDTVQTCYNDGVTGESCFSAVSLVKSWEATIAAKSFGDNASPLNYYAIDSDATSPSQFDSLIPATSASDTYNEFTIVFSLYVVDDNAGMFITGSNDSFVIYQPSNTGGGGLAFTVRDENGYGSSAYVNYTENAISLGQWHAVMITFKGDAVASPEENLIQIMIDGTYYQNGDWDSGTAGTTNKRVPIHSGEIRVGEGSIIGYPTVPFYMGYVWSDETYLDPDTYWSTFFDASNKPKQIGADGSGVTGSQPFSYFPDGDFTSNKGSGPNWTENGSVQDAPSSPLD